MSSSAAALLPGIEPVSMSGYSAILPPLPSARRLLPPLRLCGDRRSRARPAGDRPGDRATKAFFALPDEVKRRYHQPGGGGARGYTPFGIETAKGGTHVDLKEFWHVGRELPEGHPFRAVMADNVWPTEVPASAKSCWALRRARCDGRQGAARHRARPGARRRLLRADGENGNSVLRLLHYPPVPADAPGVRAGAHEDINTITLLLGAEEAGLEVLDRDGAGCRSTRRPARWSSISATCCSG
jgi:hypothetical protein